MGKDSSLSPAHVKGLRPAFIFIHGSIFYGGDLKVVENPCKAVAETANVIVILVDYTLAPEGPYPQGLNDCTRSLSISMSMQ